MTLSHMTTIAEPFSNFGRNKEITMLLVVLSTILVVTTALPSSVQWMKINPAEHIKEVKDLKAPTSFHPYDESWTAFKNEHNKVYTNDEEGKRFNIFMENVKMIEYHNQLYHDGKKSYYLGVNAFADMQFDEFKKLNGFKQRKEGDDPSQCSTYLKGELVTVPDEVDWREKGYVTPVKNQGQCGSCWSFSTTGSLEGQYFHKKGKLVSFSEQQLVDCSAKFGNEGCNGGLMDNAFHYIQKYGLETEDEYPYEAKVEFRCHYNKSEVVGDCTGCVDVSSGDEDALKQAVGSVGPVSIAIDASHQSFQLYQGGVYDEPECSSTQLDHGVLIAGYGKLDGSDYWLVKNSWGTGWGKDGYVYMSRNKENQCGVATQASYPLV
ncbi:hypothetical protein LOTGIDRAFT_221163 [Lottia gigantea]|uniref:Cathepsin L n=1 Tax=Lottia gigantea TaxID=225164 RepID=V3ZT50_LOTGI|nr:hypothetical protein LOTGIDRAFT_221163 [Lottia gigantea]ESO85745.1 hypothetical protein LOTGIDRAFT_221163 [Lottia gigantea]